jgi:hypothetical protein
MKDPREKWIRRIEFVNILLALALLVRWYTVPSPPIYTLFTNEDTIENLHRPNAVQQRIEQLGPSITVEDIIRKLHAEPELLRSTEGKELFQEMLQTQQELLRNEEALQRVELELNRTTLKLYDNLSPEDQTRIRSRRNTDSVEGIEAQYWRELLEQVEIEK